MNQITCTFLMGVLWAMVPVCAMGVEVAYSDSIQSAQKAVLESPKDASAYVKLGHAYLNAGYGDEALKAFRKGADLNGNLAAAYNGMGLVHWKMRKDLQIAERYFRQALQKDRAFIEAQYHIAKAHLKVGNHAAKGEIERLVKMDSTYAPAYYMMAKWYDQRHKYTEALPFYQRYMLLEPTDQEVGYQVGINLLALGLYEQAETFAMNVLNGPPRYGVLAHVLMHKEAYAQALQAFEFYIDYLPPEEQGLYHDISLVATAEELTTYQTVPKAKQRQFLSKFWLKHEPDLVSGGIRRRAEHYRRVWYARTYFGKVQKPWDRRGEIYIRYGDPTYRSTSESINFDVPVSVQRVQEQRAFELYGALAAGVRFYGPVFPVRTDKVTEADVVAPVIEQDFATFEMGAVPAGSVLADTLGLARYRPVTSGEDWSGVPWESWIYTDIAGGVAFVFTDELLQGRFDFAPVPKPTYEDFYRIKGDGQLSRMMLQLGRLAPEMIAQRTLSRVPEQYDIGLGMTPLHFLYDMASFMGEDGHTRVEVYAGVPVGQFFEGNVQDTLLSFRRTAALVDGGLNRIYRSRDVLRLRTTPGEPGVLVDQTDLQVLPGNYELGVQIHQQGAHRSQTYRQEVDVLDYSQAGLWLSDIQVARQVVSHPPKGSRFVKGDVQVVPAPNRAFFVDQPVYLYFEIYGLQKDHLGAVRYQMTHTIQFKKQGTVVVRALSRLGQLLGAGEGDKNVTIEYEQVGTETRLADYVALELGDKEGGEYGVSVSVKDLNNQKEAVQETFFKRIKK